MATSSVQNNTSSTGATTGTDASASANASLNNLDVDSFLKIMIAELQHQDPLNPMDSSQMLSQIGEMRQITASDKLTSTLNSVLLGQNIASSTNLIGANITGISDDSQKVTGSVGSVSIDGGTPKLHIDVSPTAGATSEKGDLDAGKYSYRITWQEGDKLVGLEYSGDHAISTSDGINVDHSIEFSDLPETTGPKQIYRTDSTGTGDYRLVTKIDGSESSFLDTLADDSRIGTTQSGGIQAPADIKRHYIVSLNNVGDISPPD